MENSLNSFSDVAMDSFYPLMTKDPKKAKEVIVRITEKKLDNAFDK